MLSRLSKHITDFFISRNAIKAEEREIYEYCFTILLSTILNGVALLLISILTKTILATLCFAVSFLVLRSAAGGFHAKTHLGCFITLMLFYAAFLCSYKFIPLSSKYILTDFYILVSLCIIFLIAPVDNENKRFDEAERIKLAKRSILSSLILSGLSVLFLYAFDLVNLAYGFAGGIFVVSISLVMGKIINVVKSKKS